MRTQTPAPPTSSSQAVSPVTLSAEKVSHEYLYYNNNPLEVNCTLNNIILTVTPFMVVFGLTMNTFALQTMKSRFLRDLTSQPVIRILLVLNCIQLVMGPLYIWFIQTFRVFITENEIYLCLLVRCSIFTVLLSTSWILVLWITEKVVTLGKPQVVWPFWRKVFKFIGNFLVILALVLGLSGLLSTKIESSIVCLPWVDVSRATDSPSVYRAFAMAFSLGPCLAFFIVLIGLLLALSMLTYRVYKVSGEMSHYQTMLMGIKTNVHLKFVSSLVWIGPLFVLTCAPIGLFIYMSPDQGTFLSKWSYPGIRIDWGGVKVTNVSHPGVTQFPNEDGMVVIKRVDIINSHGKHHQQDSMAADTEGQGDTTDEIGIDHRESRMERHLHKTRLSLRNVKRDIIKSSRIKRNDSMLAPTTKSTISARHGESGRSDDDNDNNNNNNNTSELVTNSSLWVRYPVPDNRTQPPQRNIECALWFLYYTFAWTLVPVLMATEPLFRRECRGKWYSLKTMCRLDKSMNKFPRSHGSDGEQEVESATATANTINAWKKVMTLNPTTNTNLETFVNEGNHFEQVRGGTNRDTSAV